MNKFISSNHHTLFQSELSFAFLSISLADFGVDFYVHSSVHSYSLHLFLKVNATNLKPPDMFICVLTMSPVLLLHIRAYEPVQVINTQFYRRHN